MLIIDLKTLDLFFAGWTHDFTFVGRQRFCAGSATICSDFPTGEQTARQVCTARCMWGRVQGRPYLKKKRKRLTKGWYVQNNLMNELYWPAWLVSIVSVFHLTQLHSQSASWRLPLRASYDPQICERLLDKIKAKYFSVRSTPCWLTTAWLLGRPLW